ncbi:MAG: hypothetical protein QXL96_07995 [Ignisphaera sp.]
MAVTITNEHTNAVHHLYNLIEDKVLCNNSKDRASIESKVSLPTTDITAAYLMLVFTRSTKIDVIKWKISFNDVILTRELKPHIEKPINEYYIQSILVYDVSKVMTKNDVSIRIACSAKGHLSLDGATLLAVMRYKGFHTCITCEIDPLTIDDDITRYYSLNPSFEANETNLSLGLIASSPSWLEIKTENNFIKRFDVLRGYNVVEAIFDKAYSGPIHLRTNPLHNVRYLFSCIALRYAEYPLITIEELHIQYPWIKIKLKNTGNSACDNLNLLILRYGVPLRRIQLAPLKPNTDEDIEINLDSIAKQFGGKMDGVNLRIIWSKAHKLFEHDIPLKF